MEEGKSQTSQVLKENSDISDFTCYQIDQFVQTQVYLTFFNQCYLKIIRKIKETKYTKQLERIELTQSILRMQPYT